MIKVTVINSRNQYGFVKMRPSETILELKQKLSHSMKSTHIDTMLLFLKTDEGTVGRLRIIRHRVKGHILPNSHSQLGQTDIRCLFSMLNVL